MKLSKHFTAPKIYNPSIVFQKYSHCRENNIQIFRNNFKVLYHCEQRLFATDTMSKNINNNNNQQQQQHYHQHHHDERQEGNHLKQIIFCVDLKNNDSTCTDLNKQQNRLDIFIGSKLPILSRSQIKKIIQSGCVSKLVESDEYKVTKVGFKVKNGDVFKILQPHDDDDHNVNDEYFNSQKSGAKKKSKLTINDESNINTPLSKLSSKSEKNPISLSLPSSLSTTTSSSSLSSSSSSIFQNNDSLRLDILDIIYEDDDLVVVNKPIGLIVHPAKSPNEMQKCTLVSLLVKRYGLMGLSNITDEDFIVQKKTIINATEKDAINNHIISSNQNMQSISEKISERPGIVHRIDYDTSGLLVIARNNDAHLFLKDQFKKHTISRKYVCLVFNDMPYDDGTIEGSITRHANYPSKRVAVDVNHLFRQSKSEKKNAFASSESNKDDINDSDDDSDEEEVNNSKKSSFNGIKKKKLAKHAITHYKVLERFSIDLSSIATKKNKITAKSNQHGKIFKFSLLQCELETGRTHQIRVHLSAIGRPIVGDRLYGVKMNAKKPSIEAQIMKQIIESSAIENSSSPDTTINGGQLLHAQSLGFVHPRSKSFVDFTSNIPQHFQTIVERLRSASLRYQQKQSEQYD